MTLRGVTLVETMVALAVLAIIISIGVPSYVSITQSNRATNTANELLHHL